MSTAGNSTSCGGTSESIQKYLDFDWRDERWQSYLLNLYPMPPQTKIIKWKKKWYQKHVDNTFDVTADIPSESSSSSSTSSSSSQQPRRVTPPNFGYGQNMRPNPPSPGRLKFPASISFLLSFLFAVLYVLPLGHLTAKFYSWAWFGFIFALILDLTSKYGKPQWNWDWWHPVVMEDCSQMLMYMLFTATMPRNPVIFLPLGLTAGMQVAETLVLHRSCLPDLIKKNERICNVASSIHSQRMSWMQFRSDIEVTIGGVLLIATFFSGGSGLLSVFLYFHFLKLRYSMSGFTSTTFRKLDDKISKLTDSSYCPGLVKYIYSKIKSMCRYFVEPPGAGGTGGAGRMCVIQ